MPPIGVSDVNRALRRSLWPELASRGFKERTDRATWRYAEDGVDVVAVSSVGAAADAVGCTTFSLTARAACLPRYAYPPETRHLDKSGRFRPHYWDTSLQVGLEKGLSQPWFDPFSRPPGRQTPQAFLRHGEALKRVLRRDLHDRPDVWFVLEDGSNLDEVVHDLRKVVLAVALPLLDQLHDACDALELIEAGRFVAPDSAVGLELRRKAHGACTGLYGLLSVPTHRDR